MPKLTFLGHSAFMVEGGKHKLIIDPFLSGNEQAPLKPDAVDADYILLSHGHNDHFGDTLEIAKRNDAVVIAAFELANYCEAQGVKTHGMSIGGSYRFPFGRVKMTQALHSSSTREGVYAGQPAGLLLYLDNKILYHAGDTGLFSDMKLIGQLNDIDVALLPIGDNYTMGVEDALIAAEFLQARHYLPMHYNTWPVIAADADAFVRGLAQRGMSGSAPRPGESLEY